MNSRSSSSSTNPPPPEDSPGPSYNRIAEHLYLGGKNAASNLDLIAKLKLTHILTVELIPLPQLISSTCPNLAILHIPLADVPEADLLSHLEVTTRFLRKAVEYGSVLVHCYHGVSRSAAVVAAYLMRTRSWNLKTSLEHIRTERPDIEPNPGFQDQLVLYYKMGCKLEPGNKAFKCYKLKCIQNQVTHTRILPPEVREFNHVSTADPRTDGALYRCRKCRQILATQSSVLPHYPRQRQSWTNILSSPAHSPIECKEGLFLEPLPWMGKVFSSLSDRLHCSKCNSKLGSFSWLGHVSCGCGGTMSPGIYVNVNRVDRCSMLKEVEVNL